MLRLRRRCGLVWGCLSLGWLLAIVPLAAQQGSFHRLRACGPLPADFLPAGPTLPPDTTAQPAFRIRSHYQTHQLLHSGYVLFGDSISAYLQAVGERLLSAEDAPPALRFYAVRRSSANAYASPEGIILVHVGLLAQVHSEAELAFVLSHEISHYLAGHAWERYRRHLPAAVPARFDRPEPEEAALRFSQAQEIAADSAGLLRYLATGYDPQAALEVLARLRSPVGDSLPASFEWLVQLIPSLPPPAETPSSLGHLPLTEGTDLLHPSPEARQARIARALEQLQPPRGQPALTAPGWFSRVRQQALAELPLLLLEEQAYAQALYVSGNGFPLPPSYQRWVRLRALYSLAVYGNGGRFWDVHREAGSIVGLARPVYALLEQLEGAGLTTVALALSWHWRDSLARPGEGLALTRHLVAEVWQHYPDLAADTTGWMGQILWQLRQDPAFAPYWAEGPSASAARPAPAQESQTLEGFSLGLPRVVLVDPVFQRIDERGATPSLAYTASHAAEASWVRLLDEQAHLAGLDHKVLSPHRLGAGDTAAFRDLCLLQAWLAERQALNELEMVSLYQAEVDRLSTRYATPHFLWMGGAAFTRRRSGKALIAAMGLVPIFLPYSVYYLATPHYDTLIYLMVYDLPRGEYRLIYPRLIQMRDRTDVLKSVSYDLLWQVRRTP